jgi:hypothetical protein
MICYSGVFASDDKLMQSPGDTIEVFFGDKGKIIIHVDSQEDLEVLQEYDINSMLKDIQISAQESPDSVSTLSIEDETGEKYLKEEDPEFQRLEDEFKGTAATGGAAVAASTKSYKEEPKTAPYKHRYSGKRTRWVSFLDFGMNNYLGEDGFPDASNEQYTVRPWGSWYVAIQPGWQTHITGKFALDYAVSVSWYNFKFQDASTWLIKGEDQVIFDRYPPETKATKSKLTVVYLNAFLVPTFDFGYRVKRKIYEDGTASKKTYYRNSKFRIGLGPYVGYRIDSYTKLVARPSGSKERSRTKDNFFLNNIRYGARFAVGVGVVDFFVNYDINTLFAEDRGPELNAFSFGISF